MDKVRYSRELPVVREADVVVVGGGPGGLGAALMAARSGAKVLLVEKAGLPGGMASIGEINPFMTNHLNDVSMDHPVYTEWVDRMTAWLEPESRAETTRRLGDWSRFFIHKEYAALAAEELLREAGVELLYHHELADAVVEDRNITALILSGKSGPVAVKGKIYVDSTGDGDLAARAGCRFEIGNAEGYCQPMTLCFKLSGVAIPPGGVFDPAWRDPMQQAYLAAQRSGELSCPRENLLLFPGFAPDLVHFNTTRVIKHDATDGASYSEATVIAREQLRELLRWLRREIPEFKHAQLASMAAQLGVRESRRITGIAYATRAVFEQRARFEDAVVRCNYPIDIHNPTGSGTELAYMENHEFYELPYGCIVPADCRNLLIGGRSISVDHALHSSIRVMPPVISLGQAAGIAAALTAGRGIAPAELDGREIRRRLIDAGARLE